MLNVIQYGAMIADLQICRKEQQYGLRNIGDWGEGLNCVGEKMALISGLFSFSLPKTLPPKKEHENKGSRSKKYFGGN